MKLLISALSIFTLSLFTSCGEDPCKTCVSTTYIVIDGEQFYNDDTEKMDYCGEDLQEMMDIEYTTDTIYQEEPEAVIVYTTFISCY